MCLASRGMYNAVFFEPPADTMDDCYATIPESSLDGIECPICTPLTRMSGTSERALV